jgi:hypothetical protein
MPSHQHKNGRKYENGEQNKGSVKQNKRSITSIVGSLKPEAKKQNSGSKEDSTRGEGKGWPELLGKWPELGKGTGFCRKRNLSEVFVPHTFLQAKGTFRNIMFLQALYK